MVYISILRKKISISLIKIGLKSDLEYLNKTGYMLSDYLLLDIKSKNSSKEFYIQSLKKISRKRFGFYLCI